MTEITLRAGLTTADALLVRMDIRARTMFADYFDLRSLILEGADLETTYEPSDTHLRNVRVALREGNKDDALSELHAWISEVVREVKWHGKSRSEVRIQLGHLFPDPTPDPNGVSIWNALLNIAAGVLSGEAWRLERKELRAILIAASRMRVGRYRVEFGSTASLAEGIYITRAKEAAAAWDRVFDFIADLMHSSSTTTRRWIADKIKEAYDLLETLDAFRLVLPIPPSERAELNKVALWESERSRKTQT